MTVHVVLALFIALLQTSPAQTTQTSPPTPTGATPGACAKEVRDYVVKRRAELPPMPTAATVGAGSLAAATQAANEARMTASRQIEVDRLAMAKACAAKFDVATAAPADLGDLAQLYLDAAQPELAKAAVTRALPLTNQPPAARATTLATAISIALRDPHSAERNARVEKMSDELDALPDAVIEQKIASHQSLLGYYRYDDIDAGIIKHATWLIETARTADPAVRKTLAPRVVSAYVNMAQALAGQGMNDKALELLRRAPAELSDVPTAAKSVQPEIERLELVGSPAAPLTAPRWLNMPDGAKTLDLKGKVTLLEFTAHWCIPCKESYPGVNRLRAKYGPQGFQAVFATQMWGYFQTERPLTPEVEFERDRAYFAEHHLDVPIAIGDRTPQAVRNADGTFTYQRDPNDANYKVGGIPQIHLIDRQGRIRLVMVGYDDANEAKLSKLIEQLLAEK